VGFTHLWAHNAIGGRQLALRFDAPDVQAPSGSPNAKFLTSAHYRRRIERSQYQEVPGSNAVDNERPVVTGIAGVLARTERAARNIS
jgi:hypothetical protein